MEGLYNPGKTLKSSGKEVVTEPAKPVETPAPGADDANTPAPGADDKTEEQLEEQRIAAQATMTAEEIEADNVKHAESKLTPEEKLEKETADKKKADDDNKIITDAQQAALDKVLKELGVKSLDELKTKMPQPELTPEQKADQEQKLKANVAQYAVKNGLMTMDAITNLQSLKGMDKRDIAYSNFKKEYQETHKDRMSEDGATKYPVTESEVEDSFNEFFHLDSDNAALKKTGEKLMDTFVNSIISESESKYNEATDDYKEVEARKTFFPTYDNFLKELVATVPAELSWGEGDEKIVFPTDKMDKEFIKKLYTTNAAFEAFYNSKGDEATREALRNEFNERLVAKNIDAILKVAHDVGRNLGKKEGSNVGATEPFEDKAKSGAGTPDPAVKQKEVADNDRAQKRKYYSGAREN